MDGQVPEDVKSKRLAHLSEQQAGIRRALIEAEMAKFPCQTVLFEAWDSTYIYGHTENFMEVKAPVDPSLSGSIVSVQLKGEEKGICICKVTP